MIQIDLIGAAQVEREQQGDHGLSQPPRETLIYSILVIASEAKQSRVSAKSMASGSPRHFVPRDDE
jgi:hypothetical protein